MISKSIIKVRYAETDQMGIAHHANYAIWYEVARTELIRQIGMSYSEMENQGLIVPLLELQSKYISAAYYEDELIIEARVTNLTSVKVEFEYTIYKSGEKNPINIGRTVHALVSKDLKPINVKKMFPELYQKLKSAVATPLLDHKNE